MADFWEEEYALGCLKGDGFDWFLEFDDLPLEWWLEHLGRERSVLVVGCGHSSLSGALSRRLGASVVSVDSSESCVNGMRAREPELVWEVGDARRLSELPDGLGSGRRYDAVVDKGLLDALLGYERHAQEAANECVLEMKRVLKEDGLALVFACTREHENDDTNLDGFRGGRAKCLQFFRDEDWHLESLEVPAPEGRGLSPAFDDVRPKQYAVVKAKKKMPWSDYDAYYSGDYFDDVVEPHEAFLSWKVLGPLMEPLLTTTRERKKTQLRLLEVGCGNSAVGAYLAEIPGLHYLGVDVVPAAIEQQRKRYPNLHLKVADARNLRHDLTQRPEDTTEKRTHGERSCSDFDGGKKNSPPLFDVAFDKGTADALFIYDDARSGSDDHVDRYLAELEAILEPRRGLFVVVACAREDGILQGSKAPRLWTKVAEPRGWTLETHELLRSDVGAGDRTFDYLVLRVPSSS